MTDSSAVRSAKASPLLDPETIEQQLRGHTLLFNTIADAVVILDADAVILHANYAATQITGYSREELVGQRPKIWQRPDEATRRYAEVMLAIQERGAWQGEYTLLRKDGTSRTIESKVRAVSGANGARPQTIAVLRDISEQRQLEVQLLQAQKLKAIGSLGAGIAHEINTPLQYVADNMQFLDEGLRALRSIITQGQMLADAARGHPDLAECATAFDEIVREVDLGYLDMQLPDAASHAREGCGRVREIIKALTRFATPASAGKVLTDLNASIRDSLTVCRNDWKTVATVSTHLDPDLPLVACAPAEINQVLLNVIVNAAQAIAGAHGPSQPMGRITITSRQDDAGVEIRVADDGPGIPLANQTRVFDPFFSTRDPGKGIGHGLSSAYVTIVENHGGRLAVESVEGQGATFIIHLPRASAQSQ